MTDIVMIEAAAARMQGHVRRTPLLNAPLLDNDALPFGGRKLSGNGRQLGPEGLNQFQNTKFVMIDPKAENQDFWWFPYAKEESFRGA